MIPGPKGAMTSTRSNQVPGRAEREPWAQNGSFLIEICIFDDSSFWLKNDLEGKIMRERKNNQLIDDYFLIELCIFDGCGFWLLNEFFERIM